MGFSGRQHIVVRLVLLQHQPHALDKVPGMSPVAPGIQIAQIELVLQAELDRGNGAGDLAGDEGLAAQRALVIEQDTVGGVQVIGLPIVHRDPVGIELGGGIGAARPERGCLALRRFLHLAIEFGCGCLIETDGLLHPQDPDRLQQSQRSDRIGVCRIFRGLETDLNVALGSEIVDLVGLDLLHDPQQVGGVGQITIMQVQLDSVGVWILIKMLQPPGIERRRTAFDAMDDIALRQQQLGQIGTILSGHTCNQGCPC